MKDKRKFLEAWHENQGPRERNERQKKKYNHCRIIALLGDRVTPTIAPHPCVSNEIAISFFATVIVYTRL